MKGFVSLFYTRLAKAIYIISVLVLSYIIADCQIDYFTLYSSDNESFINVISQIDSFEYESSYYFKNTVNNAVEGVVKLAMEYEEVFESDKTVEEMNAYYNGIGDKSFPEIYEQLSSITGFSFAVVNHDKNRIYSNIDEINGKSSGEFVQSYFGETGGKNVLIARSCKNPYFATGSFIEFADEIRDCANEYDDNFDLYISFGTMEDFNARAESCKELHFEMRSKIEKLNDTIAVLIILLIVVVSLIITVTGKHERKGKTYLTEINKIPNDLLIIMYSVVLSGIVTLYRTSSMVIVSYGSDIESLWFLGSEDFYLSRIRLCIMVFVCGVVSLLCALKRAYKTDTLLSNTYVYPFIMSYKDKFSEIRQKNKSQNN